MKSEPVELAAFLRGAHRILVFTGAGISTRSGIPDYRGPRGVWKTERPVEFGDFLASEAERRRYWEMKLAGWREHRDARPNAAHEAIVELERAGRVGMVVTQNVDGLHRRAGTSPEKLVEIHGTHLEIECLDCGARCDPEGPYERFARERRPPRCSCGGLLKPATISFGQSLREEDIARSFAAAAEADLVLALGSTLSVTPAAGIPLVAVERGAPYVIVNQGETEHDRHPGVRLRVEGDVTEILPPAVDSALSGA